MSFTSEAFPALTEAKVPAVIAFVSVLLSVFLLPLWYSGGVKVSSRSHLAAFIIENHVSHARLLPKRAKHSFAYPILQFLVSLDALESGRLDLARGRLFGYGGTRFPRVTGLRPSAYLQASGCEGYSIKEKLRKLLDESAENDNNILRDAWMLTMSSFVGFEGINPLTVYFCYRDAQSSDNCPWAVVLEVCWYCLAFIFHHPGSIGSL